MEVSFRLIVQTSEDGGPFACVRVDGRRGEGERKMDSNAGTRHNITLNVQKREPRQGVALTGYHRSLFTMRMRIRSKLLVATSSINLGLFLLTIHLDDSISFIFQILLSL